MSGAGVRGPRRRLLVSVDGFTFIEAMIAVLVVAFSLVGLYQAFGYGQAFIFKAGIRRQALPRLHAEMECWRELLQRDPQRLRKLGAGAQAVKPVLLHSSRHIPASVQSELTGVLEDGDMRYRGVTVRLWYNEDDLADTIRLETRLYLAR